MRDGQDALWLWFGLSHSTWLTMPRVMMHAMPDDWQARMAALCQEWDAHWRNMPDMGTRVQVTRDGRLSKTPKWVLDYRHPDRAVLASMAMSEAAPK